LDRPNLPSDEIPQRTERDRRARLEHVLLEEVGQKLTRILGLAAALRSPSLSAEDLAIDLGNIADRLAEAIRDCTTAATYFDQQLLPCTEADDARPAAESKAREVSRPSGADPRRSRAGAVFSAPRQPRE
jgi:hypothetical protein